jgi:hypothetical protein
LAEEFLRCSGADFAQIHAQQPDGGLWHQVNRPGFAGGCLF